MKVILAKTAGFCFGVRRAVKIAEKAALRRSRMTEAQRKKADEKAAKKAAALAELWQKEQAKAKPFYEKMQKALGEDNI